MATIQSKRSPAPKPKLFVQISHFQSRETDPKERQYRKEGEWAPLQSAKNLHELKRFNFSADGLEIFNNDKRMGKLRKLQEQKKALMQSLQILKISAVSAIIEKEDELEKLRQENTHREERGLEFYEQELKVNTGLCQELEEEREAMQQRMRQERYRYMGDLEEKQYLIESLHQQIQDIRAELELLQTKDVIKSEQIKFLREENCELSEQLEHHAGPVAISGMKLEPIGRKASCSPTSAGSYSPRSRQTNCVSTLDYQNLFLRVQDRVYLSNKLEEKKNLHRSEMLWLKNSYENQIDGLKEILERENTLPVSNHTETEHTMVHSASKQSLRSHRSEKSLSRCPSESILQQQVQSDGTSEDQVEKELNGQLYARQNLKSEIKAYNFERESRRKGSMDANSEFTLNHFENPFRFMSRVRSTDTLTEVDLVQIKPNQIEQKEDGAEQRKEFKKQNSSWSTPALFLTGLLSGVTVTSIVGYFANRKKD